MYLQLSVSRIPSWEAVTPNNGGRLIPLLDPHCRDRAGEQYTSTSRDDYILHTAFFFVLPKDSNVVWCKICLKYIFGLTYLYHVSRTCLSMRNTSPSSPHLSKGGGALHLLFLLSKCCGVSHSPLFLPSHGIRRNMVTKAPTTTTTQLRKDRNPFPDCISHSSIP